MSAKGEPAVRTVVATARMAAGTGTFTTVLGTISTWQPSTNLDGSKNLAMSAVF